ncbi:MAG: hypothetical protein GC190_11560 [Alphaproteobacteria bacterium]|nr:hypothetical protein [Alphaproteobacteria bacterium]
MTPEQSVLKVRRSILINAAPEAVWQKFADHKSMESWWGYRTGTPEAGTSKGQYLDRYEPQVGGRIVMSVNWNGERVSYGGKILSFAQGGITFENNWIPSQGWKAPTYITIRIAPALNGTLVELFHHGFERIGGDVAAEHEGFEAGWGMTQLSELKRICE